jgi:hypothetical protein
VITHPRKQNPSYASTGNNNVVYEKHAGATQIHTVLYTLFTMNILCELQVPSLCQFQC